MDTMAEGLTTLMVCSIRWAPNPVLKPIVLTTHGTPDKFAGNYEQFILSSLGTP